MNNCFVTKIQDALPNDATHNPMLHKLDEVVIPVTSTVLGEQRGFVFNLATVKLLGDAKFITDGVESDEIKEGSNINNSHAINVTALGNLYYKVKGFNDVKRVAYSGGKLTFDIKRLKDFTALTSLSLTGTQCSGDIKNLANMTALTSLNLGGTQCSGDIKNLANMTALTSLNLNGTQCSGTIESIAEGIAKANVAHTLKIWTLTTDHKITYNGNYGSERVWTITFAEDGTYSVENKSE